MNEVRIQRLVLSGVPGPLDARALARALERELTRAMAGKTRAPGAVPAVRRAADTVAARVRSLGVRAP